jgi:hypothetical protein
MRAIKTFVLHLYIDPDAPERLCGDVRLLEGRGNFSFKNQVELEELLHRLCKKPAIKKDNLPGTDPGLDA